jgi:tetratricopeptide (TPR) repeat protein
MPNLTQAADAAFRAGRPEEGESLCREALKSDPNNGQALALLGRSRIEARDLAAGIPLLEAAIRLLPPNADMLLYAARSLAEHDRLTDAAAYARKAVELAPTHARALLQLATILQLQGDWRESGELLRRSLDSQPDNAMTYWAIARSRRMTDSDLPFVQQITEAAARSQLPAGPRSYFYYALGKAYEDLYEYDRSFHGYQEANRLARLAHFGDKPFDREFYKGVIDRTISVLDKAFIARNRHLGNSSDLPVFIVGMVRSGTTLTEQIVSSHPQAGSAGELTYWLENGERAFNENLDLDPAATASIQKEYLRILGELVPGKARVIDKMPHNDMVLGALNAFFPNAALLRLKRDPADNCMSIYATPFPGPPDYAFDWESIVYALEQFQGLGAHWRATLESDRFLEVDYESLVTDQEAVTRRIIGHCRLDWNDACLRPEENRRAVATPSTWQVRQKVYSSSKGRWKPFEKWLPGPPPAD